jgi:hypothetical protein
LARDFDAVNDEIDLGADASIADLPVFVFMAWIAADAKGNYGRVLMNKVVGNTGNYFYITPGNVSPVAARDKLDLEAYSWTGLAGKWYGSTNFTDTSGARVHIAIVYDPSGGTGAQPLMYVNGVLDTVTTAQTPSGTYTESDATNPARIVALSQFNGRMECVVFHGSVLDAAAVNRARWWGRPNGGLLVYHPLWTDKLANEGTATADGTATGTTVSAAMMTPVVRPGSAMMGMGVGW